MTPRTMILTGATLGGLAVAAGAFGAHGLKEQLTQSGQIGNFETAVRYQMWHALALLACAALSRGNSSPRGAAWCFTAGTIVFAGTLYGIALSGVRWLGAITPIGGALIIAGWIALIVFAVRREHE